MKKSFMLAALALTAAAAGPAIAEQSGTATSTASSGKGAAADKDKVVCRKDTATGSRLRVNRVCMTKGQWDELAEKNRKSMDDFSRRAGQAPPPEPSNGPG